MGLSQQLDDVSTDSIPILLVLTAAGWVSHLRYLLLCLLNSVGLINLNPTTSSSSSAALGSGLAGLADRFSSCRAFPYTSGGQTNDCMVCLCVLGDGERVRSLPCSHVFHSKCIDGWFDVQVKLSCLLCRSPLERNEETERRIGAELIAWLSPHYLVGLVI